MIVGQTLRNVEKLLDEAQLTGELLLSGRGIRELPPGHRELYVDLLSADLSQNRLQEVPGELVELSSCLEQLELQYNTVRQLPDDVSSLRSLAVINLSRNQLSYLPASLCQLPLQVLVVSYNRLVSLPEEIGQLSATLCELDAHCNELCQLPVTLVKLERLASLNLRRNSLHHLPEDIDSLVSLRQLDVAENQLCALPLRLRLLPVLQQLHVHANPLLQPPAAACSRGYRHVFKLLQQKAQRGQLEERVRRAGSELHQSPRPPPLGAELGVTPAPSPLALGARHSVAGAVAAGVGVKTTSNGRPSSESGRSTRSESSVFSPICGFNRSSAASCLSPYAKSPSHGPAPHSPASLPSYSPATALSPHRSFSQSSPHSVAATPPSSTLPNCLPAPSSLPPQCPSPGRHHSTVARRLSSHGPADPGLASDTVDTVDSRSIDRLRKNIEQRLRVSLPDDLRSALRDGVVLCHLANHVRSRSVPSIHVPSPAVPHLNDAKCRRNLANFIEACRCIGVEEECLCRVEDVASVSGLTAVSLTVDQLIFTARLNTASPSLQSTV